MSDEPENYGMTAEGQVVYTLPEPGPLGKHAGSWAVKGTGKPDLTRYSDELLGVPLSLWAHRHEIEGLRLGPFGDPNEAHKAYHVNYALVVHSDLADYIRLAKMKMSLYGATVRYIGDHEFTEVFKDA